MAGPPTDEFRMVVQRLDHGLVVRRTEWRDEGGRDLQVGRHAHLGNRDDCRLDQRIKDFATLQKLGQGVTHLFADAQHALGWA
jgi:hypothetical protein